jgi:CRISPR/Cas system-associated endoribonuclease Cas2
MKDKYLKIENSDGKYNLMILLERAKGRKDILKVGKQRVLQEEAYELKLNELRDENTLKYFIIDGYRDEEDKLVIYEISKEPITHEELLERYYV